MPGRVGGPGPAGLGGPGPAGEGSFRPAAAAKASAAAMFAAAEAAETTLLLRLDVWGGLRQSRGAAVTYRSSKVLSAASAAANIAAAEAFAAADFSDGGVGPAVDIGPASDIGRGPGIDINLAVWEGVQEDFVMDFGVFS